MKIKLVTEWLGHQPDSILDLKVSMAKILLDRGTALAVENEKELNSGPESSGKMQKPKRNKMVDWALNK